MNAEIHLSLCGLIHKRSQELGGREIEPSERLADLGIDSLENLSLVVDVENYFDIRIDDAQLVDVHTVGDLTTLIGALRSRA